MKALTPSCQRSFYIPPVDPSGFSGSDSDAEDSPDQSRASKDPNNATTAGISSTRSSTSSHGEPRRKPEGRWEGRGEREEEEEAGKRKLKEEDGEEADHGDADDEDKKKEKKTLGQPEGEKTDEKKEASTGPEASHLRDRAPSSPSPRLPPAERSAAGGRDARGRRHAERERQDEAEKKQKTRAGGLDAKSAASERRRSLVLQRIRDGKVDLTTKRGRRELADVLLRDSEKAEKRELAKILKEAVNRGDADWKEDYSLEESTRHGFLLEKKKKRHARREKARHERRAKERLEKRADDVKTKEGSSSAQRPSWIYIRLTKFLVRPSLLFGVQTALDAQLSGVYTRVLKNLTEEIKRRQKLRREQEQQQQRRRRTQTSPEFASGEGAGPQVDQKNSSVPSPRGFSRRLFSRAEGPGREEGEEGDGEEKKALQDLPSRRGKPDPETGRKMSRKKKKKTSPSLGSDRCRDTETERSSCGESSIVPLFLRRQRPQQRRFLSSSSSDDDEDGQKRGGGEEAARESFFRRRDKNATTYLHYCFGTCRLEGFSLSPRLLLSLLLLLPAQSDSLCPLADPFASSGDGDETAEEMRRLLALFSDEVLEWARGRISKRISSARSLHAEAWNLRLKTSLHYHCLYVVDEKRAKDLGGRASRSSLCLSGTSLWTPRRIDRALEIDGFYDGDRSRGTDRMLLDSGGCQPQLNLESFWSPPVPLRKIGWSTNKTPFVSYYENAYPRALDGCKSNTKNKKKKHREFVHDPEGPFSSPPSPLDFASSSPGLPDPAGALGLEDVVVGHPLGERDEGGKRGGRDTSKWRDGPTRQSPDSAPFFCRHQVRFSGGSGCCSLCSMSSPRSRALNGSRTLSGEGGGEGGGASPAEESQYTPRGRQALSAPGKEPHVEDAAAEVGDSEEVSVVVSDMRRRVENLRSAVTAMADDLRLNRGRARRSSVTQSSLRSRLSSSLVFSSPSSLSPGGLTAGSSARKSKNLLSAEGNHVNGQGRCGAGLQDTEKKKLFSSSPFSSCSSLRVNERKHGAGEEEEGEESDEEEEQDSQDIDDAVGVQWNFPPFLLHPVYPAEAATDRPSSPPSSPPSSARVLRRTGGNRRVSSFFKLQKKLVLLVWLYASSVRRLLGDLDAEKDMLDDEEVLRRFCPGLSTRDLSQLKERGGPGPAGGGGGLGGRRQAVDDLLIGVMRIPLTKPSSFQTITSGHFLCPFYVPATLPIYMDPHQCRFFYFAPHEEKKEKKTDGADDSETRRSEVEEGGRGGSWGEPKKKGESLFSSSGTPRPTSPWRERATSPLGTSHGRRPGGAEIGQEGEGGQGRCSALKQIWIKHRDPLLPSSSGKKWSVYQEGDNSSSASLTALFPLDEEEDREEDQAGERNGSWQKTGELAYGLYNTHGGLVGGTALAGRGRGPISTGDFVLLDQKEEAWSRLRDRVRKEEEAKRNGRREETDATWGGEEEEEEGEETRQATRRGGREDGEMAGDLQARTIRWMKREGLWRGEDYLEEEEEEHGEKSVGDVSDNSTALSQDDAEEQVGTQPGRVTIKSTSEPSSLAFFSSRFSTPADCSSFWTKEGELRATSRSLSSHEQPPTPSFCLSPRNRSDVWLRSPRAGRRGEKEEERTRRRKERRGRRRSRGQEEGRESSEDDDLHSLDLSSFSSDSADISSSVLAPSSSSSFSSILTFQRKSKSRTRSPGKDPKDQKSNRLPVSPRPLRDKGNLRSPSSPSSWRSSPSRLLSPCPSKTSSQATSLSPRPTPRKGALADKKILSIHARPPPRPPPSVPLRSPQERRKLTAGSLRGARVISSSPPLPPSPAVAPVSSSPARPRQASSPSAASRGSPKKNLLGVSEARTRRSSKRVKDGAWETESAEDLDAGSASAAPSAREDRRSLFMDTRLAVEERGEGEEKAKGTAGAWSERSRRRLLARGLPRIVFGEGEGQVGEKGAGLIEGAAGSLSVSETSRGGDADEERQTATIGEDGERKHREEPRCASRDGGDRSKENIAEAKTQEKKNSILPQDAVVDGSSISSCSPCSPPASPFLSPPPPPPPRQVVSSPPLVLLIEQYMKEKLSQENKAESTCQGGGGEERKMRPKPEEDGGKLRTGIKRLGEENNSTSGSLSTSSSGKSTASRPPRQGLSSSSSSSSLSLQNADTRTMKAEKGGGGTCLSASASPFSAARGRSRGRLGNENSAVSLRDLTGRRGRGGERERGGAEDQGRSVAEAAVALRMKELMREEGGGDWAELMMAEEKSDKGGEGESSEDFSFLHRSSFQKHLQELEENYRALKEKKEGERRGMRWGPSKMNHRGPDRIEDGSTLHSAARPQESGERREGKEEEEEAGAEGERGQIGKGERQQEQSPTGPSASPSEQKKETRLSDQEETCSASKGEIQLGMEKAPELARRPGAWGSSSALPPGATFSSLFASSAASGRELILDTENRFLAPAYLQQGRSWESQEDLLKCLEEEERERARRIEASKRRLEAFLSSSPPPTSPKKETHCHEKELGCFSSSPPSSLPAAPPVSSSRHRRHSAGEDRKPRKEAIDYLIRRPEETKKTGERKNSERFPDDDNRSTNKESLQSSRSDSSHRENLHPHRHSSSSSSSAFPLAPPLLSDRPSGSSRPVFREDRKDQGHVENPPPHVFGEDCQLLPDPPSGRRESTEKEPSPHSCARGERREKKNPPLPLSSSPSSSPPPSPSPSGKTLFPSQSTSELGRPADQKTRRPRSFGGSELLQEKDPREEPSKLSELLPQRKMILSSSSSSSSTTIKPGRERHKFLSPQAFVSAYSPGKKSS